MKMSEYFASIIIDAIALSAEGKSLRPYFKILENLRGLLPYNAQLDVHASSLNELSFVADVPYGDVSLPCLVVVRPSFLGLDITVTGIEDAELRHRVAMDFFNALDEDVKTEDDC